MKIQEAQKALKADEKPFLTEWAEEHEGALEYSVYGWFRYESPTLLKENTLVFRLTNNEPAYRKEMGQVGDRTFLAVLNPKEFSFHTYTMGLIDSGSEHSIKKSVAIGNRFGVWTYVWFGYSWNKRVASAIVRYPDATESVGYTNILHMVPKYLALFVGSDGLLGNWVGPIQNVGAIFGKGAYIDPSKGNFDKLLPDYTPPEGKAGEFKVDPDDLILVP